MNDIKVVIKINYQATLVCRWPRYLNLPLMAMRARMEFKMVDHRDRMDPWMETPPGVGGSWDRRGTLACPPSPSPARGLMTLMPTANLWHSGWLIINKPCWWKSCKFSVVVWQVLWNSIHGRQFLIFIRIFVLCNKLMISQNYL